MVHVPKGQLEQRGEEHKPKCATKDGRIDPVSRIGNAGGSGAQGREGRNDGSADDRPAAELHNEGQH
jgi:hypothetical protein